jgi:CO dehydrogenase maturation factor
MPIFHCPMGAPYYEAENCILCGLCLAMTTEERIEATKKIREYLRSRPERKGLSKKIAICGKGGVGKSTIVTLMAKAMAEDGYRILVLDNDESNPGLFRMFGFEIEPKPLITLLSRFAEQEPMPDTKWLTKDEISFEDIPSEYTLEVNNLKLMMVGKITDPLQGCACTMADVTRAFMGKLLTKDKETVLVDMEAGIESFGRGMERNVDTVLIIIEPSYESIALAGKIEYMADGIGVSKVRAILNKISSEEVERKIMDELEKKEIRSIGTVHLDSRMNEANFEGKALGDSNAMEEVKEIVRRLLVESL